MIYVLFKLPYKLLKLHSLICSIHINTLTTKHVHLTLQISHEI